MTGIYRIRNLINEKCYYGSSKDVDNRWRVHKRDLVRQKHINKILQNAWNKYGEENFVFELIEECAENELFLIEQKYLDTNPEYNIGLKSSGGDNFTKNPNRYNIIEKMTESLKRKYSLMTDEERKEKHSRPMETNPNWKGGISISYCKTCGIKISQNAQYCKKHTIYDRVKEKNSFYGKIHSEETKRKLSEKRMGNKPTNMKKVKIDGIEYESLAEASRQTGIPSPTILWRIKSKNKKYDNYYQSHPTIKAPLSN